MIFIGVRERETHLKLRHKVARETGLGGLEQML